MLAQQVSNMARELWLVRLYRNRADVSSCEYCEFDVVERGVAIQVIRDAAEKDYTREKTYEEVHKRNKDSCYIYSLYIRWCLRIGRRHIAHT